MAYVTQSGTAPTYFTSDTAYTINWPANGSDINYSTASVGANFITTPAPPKAEGISMKTSTKTVRLIAGYVGQVFVYDTGDIVWESAPKKTLAKADKAAKKAQLRAVKRSFE